MIWILGYNEDHADVDSDDGDRRIHDGNGKIIVICK